MSTEAAAGPFRGSRAGLVPLVARGLSACLALWLAGCATAPPVQLADLPFPAPSSGPGRPAIDNQSLRQIDEGWRALRTGDVAAARLLAAKAGANPAARLLELQAAIVAQTGDSFRQLSELTADTPGYAAAWLTLSVAAEDIGNERAALKAAERGAELWPDGRWRDRAADLRRQWIDDRLATGRRMAEDGEAAAASAAAERVLQLEPDNRDAALLQARAFVDLGELDRAEAVLSRLPRDRNVVMLAGRIADARGDRRAAIRIYSSLENDPEALWAAIEIARADHDWLTAMNLYQELPDEDPEKTAGLRESKLRWRLSVSPTYVHEAVTARHLDRAGLATILVTLAPDLETSTGGQVPLLSDIVNMPAQREIVTAARVGLVDVDELEHRFHPGLEVTSESTRAAVDRLAHLMGAEPPTWCAGENDDDCIEVVDPVSGTWLSEVVIHMLARSDR